MIYKDWLGEINSNVGQCIKHPTNCDLLGEGIEEWVIGRQKGGEIRYSC